MNYKVALITGASSGLGFETALLLAEKGYKVYATMRNLDKQDTLKQAAKDKNLNIIIKELDVTKVDSIETTVNAILEDEDTINVLINNAGAGFARTTEHATDEEMMWQVNLNLMGVMRMTKAILPTMRTHRQGHIVNISSVGGLVGQPFNEIYCATKFGVEGYTEALASYIQPEFNVKFSVIEPGGIQSEFTNNLMAHLESTGGIQEDEYLPLFQSYMGGLKENYGPGASQTSAEVAQVIIDTIEMEEPPVRVRTSAWSEDFTRLKTEADPTGKLLQAQVKKLLGK
ncbi:SDR family oxidoreductase [Staphylococcus pragensis]|uniref:SDR family oxidoreductase n=1 Tax=Staphylococcus pragensis TaxID=1611836 RepID=A0A4Z1B0E3_9STAP|nr:MULTISPECIES: SDR family oxidoreductase [Staphylococcus]RTX89053.1 SDR family oxidoreductase [Staphylococcus carnosus]TGN26513.1 SDR family oxidoreductase [Staphylococcus pragensis]GGG95310.1 short-chain dehydrogenase/reductase [Staphylococcus pragensis]